MKLTQRIVKLIDEVVEGLLRLANDQLLQKTEKELLNLLICEVLFDLLRLFKFLNSIHFCKIILFFVIIYYFLRSTAIIFNFRI